MEKNLIQSESFEYKGLTIKREDRSVTQGSFTVYGQDGKQIGESFRTDMLDTINDGRENMFKKTDEEIKEVVDWIIEDQDRKKKIVDLLKNCPSFTEGQKHHLAKYFTSPAFPDLQGDITQFKKESVQETKQAFLGLVAFQPGAVFSEDHAEALAKILHTPNDENQTAFENLLNKKATIFKYGEMGFAHSIMCEIKKVYRADYAQYRNILHVIYRPKGKRTDYVFRIYGYESFALYAGHVVLNAEMFVKENASGGVTIRESLLSFSPEYLERALASTTEKPVLVIRK